MTVISMYFDFFVDLRQINLNCGFGLLRFRLPIEWHYYWLFKCFEYENFENIFNWAQCTPLTWPFHCKTFNFVPKNIIHFSSIFNVTTAIDINRYSFELRNLYFTRVTNPSHVNAVACNVWAGEIAAQINVARCWMVFFPAPQWSKWFENYSSVLTIQY